MLKIELVEVKTADLAAFKGTLADRIAQKEANQATSQTESSPPVKPSGFLGRLLGKSKKEARKPDLIANQAADLKQDQAVAELLTNVRSLRAGRGVENNQYWEVEAIVKRPNAFTPVKINVSRRPSGPRPTEAPVYQLTEDGHIPHHSDPNTSPEVVGPLYEIIINGVLPPVEAKEEAKAA